MSVVVEEAELSVDVAVVLPITASIIFWNVVVAVSIILSKIVDEEVPSVELAVLVAVEVEVASACPFRFVSKFVWVEVATVVDGTSTVVVASIPATTRCIKLGGLFSFVKIPVADSVP